jgi:parallel beta-helix repeat protein
MSKTRQNSGVPIGSIAELRLTSGANEAVELLGYYTKGDGGGGTFYWDSTSIEDDNGGTTIEATGVTTGRWCRVYSGAVNVKWFGATGDGTTDDTLAIQATFNYTGNIRFDVGVYILTSSILFNTFSYVIKGAGTGCIIKSRSDLGTFDLFDINGNSGPLKHISLINFNGPGLSNYGGGAAIGGSGNGLVIDSCWFAGIIKGVGVAGSFISVTNCTFEYCYYGIYNTTPIECNITDNMFYKNEQADIFVSGTCKSFLISGVNTVAVKNHSIHLNDCIGAIVENIVAENDGTGHTPNIVRLNGTSTHNIIRNVNARNYGNYIVFLEGSNVDYNIVDSVVANHSAIGVYIVLGSYNNILNCNISNATEKGIYLNTAPDNIISNCFIDSCSYGVNLFAASGNRLSEIKTTNSTTKGLYVASTTTTYENACHWDNVDNTAPYRYEINYIRNQMKAYYKIETGKPVVSSKKIGGSKEYIIGEEPADLIAAFSFLTKIEKQQIANVQALKYLKDTDWYILRYSETGKSIPKEILSKREEQRNLVQKGISDV